jgi:hypothetical protein
MPIDPLWKRALKAVVEIKEPPLPPPPEPIPQSAYDELDGALTIQARREARRNLTPAPPDPAPGEGDSPVDADGLVDFARLYAQAGVPAVPFTAEQALDMLQNMPANVSEDARQQIIGVTLSALGRSVGGTPEAIVADAARKQAALQEFRRARGDQLVELTGTAQARIAALEREIAESREVIARATRQYETLSGNCQAEEARLDGVVDFFSQPPAQDVRGARRG